MKFTEKCLTEVSGYKQQYKGTLNMAFRNVMNNSE